MSKEDIEAVKMALLLLKQRVSPKDSPTDNSISGLRRIIKKYCGVT